jgi:hypothetical protein
VSGYRKKPLWVVLLAVALWLNTAGMPVQVMFWFGHGPTEWAAILAKLTLQNKIVMALSPVAALGVQQVAPWGRWATLVFLAAAVANNLILLRFSTPVPRFLVVASILIVTGTALWLLRPAAARLFRCHELHWWKPAPRRVTSIPVAVENGQGARLDTRTFNISRSGLFVPSPAGAMSLGDRVRVCLRFEARVLRGWVSVVRYTGACSTHPEGFGLQFSCLALADRMWLRMRLAEVRS